MKVILSEVVLVVSYFVGSYFVRELFGPRYYVRVIFDKLFRPKAPKKFQTPLSLAVKPKIRFYRFLATVYMAAFNNGLSLLISTHL